MKPLALVVTAILALNVCAAPTTQPQFEIGFWLGPPEKFTTIERYREIKDANFTIAFPPLTTPSPQLNHKILDLCEQVGLRAMIADERMPQSLAEKDARSQIEAIVKDYAQHPALYGYFIKDEPSAGDFEGLGQVAAYLREKDPAHIGYINLFPTGAAPWAQLGTATYDEYLEKFITTVKPKLLSYDHYPFHNSGDNADYFLNFALVRNAGIKHTLPFWYIALCVQHYDYRHLTEPELRYETMTSLCFGAHGLLWYTYWYPGEPNPTILHAMINYDGSHDPHYDMIKQINADTNAIGTELLEARSWATYQVGEAVEQRPPSQGTPIDVTTKGKITVGLFTRPDKSWMGMIANRDYKAAGTASISSAKFDVFEPRTKKWSPAKSSGLKLAAGDAVLIRFTTDK
jgi:hypothetical protein